jgi:hypothetical protein
MRRLLSIDPGEVHCGIAIWLDDTCIQVEEYLPEVLWENMEFWLLNGVLDVVVIEGYWLYPWLLKEQGFSEVRTVETIGVARFLCKKYGVPIAVQKATIKIPTRAQMRARGVENLATVEGKGGHCADAVLHGFYYISTTKG